MDEDIGRLPGEMAKKPKLKDLSKKIRLESKKCSGKRISDNISKESPEKLETTVHHVWNDKTETSVPFRADIPNEVILIIGDGDLSYSAALVRLNEDYCDKLICTTFDSRDLLLDKYGDRVRKNIEFLESKGVNILDGIDGTKLHTGKEYARISSLIMERNIGKIVFNFPHSGAGIKDRDRNIRAQQELIRTFLISCKNLLVLRKKSIRYNQVKFISRSAIQRNKNGPSSEELTAIRKNRPVDDSDDDVDFEMSAVLVPEVHLTVRTGDPYDDWNVKALGNSVQDFVCFESYRFEPEKFPGYQHVKTIGDIGFAEVGEDGDFLKKPAKTYVFKLQLDKRNKL